MVECRLTTMDNPYDPFDQFTQWLLFDNEMGYNSCGKLDRIAHISNEKTEQEKHCRNTKALGSQYFVKLFSS